MFASQKEVEMNISFRDEEPNSLMKSDADLSIHHHYQELMKEHQDSLSSPSDAKIISLTTRSKTFEEEIDELAKDIIFSGHRLIIMGGNVLTGKTYTSKKLKMILEEQLNIQ